MKNGKMFSGAMALSLVAALSLSCQTVQSQVVAKKVAAAPQKVEMVNLAFKPYPVSPGCNRSFEQMIVAGGYGLLRDSEVRIRDFPSKRCAAETNLYLISLGYIATSGQVIEYMGKRGCKPAGEELLLAFGEKYPEKQLEFPIVALGSIVSNSFGRGYASYLAWEVTFRPILAKEGTEFYNAYSGNHEPTRSLYLFVESGYDERWSESVVFLAVCG